MVDALAPDRSDQPFGEAGDFAEVQGGRHAYALVAKGIFTPALTNSRRAEVSCMRRAPQLGIAAQGLPFLRRRAIPGHRGLHERLERARGDLLPFLDVDRPSRVAFQAGMEGLRGVWDAGPPGERELHDLRVRLP